MKIMPLGDRIIVKRRTIGETVGKAGLIIATAKTKETPMDIADVLEVPDLTKGDMEIVKNIDDMISSMIKKTKEGDSKALTSLITLNAYHKIKDIKVGDCVMLSKYVGTTFVGKDGQEERTIVNADDIIGVVKE